ncbi:MAG: adenylate/guanylate cyclase domain-containing protein, partial [Candidatus Rokuibacteriota bacterium]
LEEIVRGLIADGVLVREDSGWRCTADAATVDVPPTIQGLLLSRVDRLPPATRRVVQEAAVLGPEFEASLLRRVSSEPAACASALALLQESQLLEEAAPPMGAPKPSTATRSRYRFTNTLVQEVVYQSLLVRRRLELHGRVGQVLEAAVGEHPQGHHFSLSDEKLKGVRYLLEAADWARGVYANDDAVRHYERGLATLGDDARGEAERLAVRERLGDLLAPMGRREEALKHYGAVLARGRDAGDRAAQARLHRKIGGLHWETGDRGRALADFQAGLALLEGETEHIELAHLYQEMGRLAFRSGDNPGAIHWAERALAHAERLASAPPQAATALDPEARKESALAVSHAHNTLGVALARTGRLSDAVEHIEQSVAVAQSGELLQAACRGYTNLGVLYSTLDPKRAIETCLKGLETAKRIGDLGFQSRLQTNLAVAYCALTDRCEEQGIVAAQAAIELDRQLGQLDHLAVPLIVLGQIQQCHGDPELAFKYFREALELVEEVGEPQLLFPCYDGLATLHLDRGEEAEAEQYMLKAQQVCERAGLEPDSLLVLPFLE